MMHWVTHNHSKMHLLIKFAVSALHDEVRQIRAYYRCSLVYKISHTVAALWGAVPPNETDTPYVSPQIDQCEGSSQTEKGSINRAVLASHLDYKLRAMHKSRPSSSFLDANLGGSNEMDSLAAAKICAHWKLVVL